jgi:uncharacterized membrane protein
MSPLGLIHTAFALVALATGAAVLIMRKGTRAHRTVGHFYFTSMVALNLTALPITRLFGGFGPFHYMAIVSLVTLILGMASVLGRWPRRTWMQTHARLLMGSYVGLLAATASEVVTRVVDDRFFDVAVALASAGVIGVGAALIYRYMQRDFAAIVRAQ